MVGLIDTCLASVCISSLYCQSMYNTECLQLAGKSSEASAPLHAIFITGYSDQVNRNEDVLDTTHHNKCSHLGTLLSGQTGALSRRRIG